MVDWPAIALMLLRLLLQALLFFPVLALSWVLYALGCPRLSFELEDWFLHL